MTKKMMFWLLMGILVVIGLLVGANLLGYGPAVVSNDEPRVILPRSHRAKPVVPESKWAAY